MTGDSSTATVEAALRQLAGAVAYVAPARMRAAVLSAADREADADERPGRVRMARDLVDLFPGI